MAQFVTHIQPTLLEASQGHVPHHHAHQVGLQHTSHLPHSGHNMPSPPTTHNHQHHQQYQHHHQQQSSHHSHHHSPPSQVLSPPATGGHFPQHHHQQHQHQQQQQQHHHHHHHSQGKIGKHEHCPTGHQSSGDGNTSFLRAARAGNLDKVLEHLKNNIDINTSNANGLNALHLASKDGHIHVVSELLRRGAIVDSATKKGNTALHIASLAGQEEVVKMLLQHGASVNVQSQNGFTPLYMAAQENHDSVVKLLLSNGANQSLATEDGFTPLAVAMQQGHDKVVAVLLESDTRGKVRLPALHIAAKKDDVKAATLLLDNDHNPDVTSKSGFTPLHIASHYGNQAIANLLIQKGADVNFSAKHNISPLHVAAKWGKTNMVSLLLEKGANIEAKTRDGLTPLHCAARSGHEQVVDMLLERGAPISAKTKNGLAPLHMAAQGEHVDAARILLYHRAPVDEVTVDYLTALHVAAHCGHVRVAKLLLDRNADANARALNGFTPLHIACKKNRIKVVELLLRHGASISATTESGLTPLHVAAFMGCMNIVIYLLQHDASPDVPTVRGETPLHLAARANQTDIIRILLRNGAQVDARAREQQTPLHIASRLGNVDIVMLLLQHGAQVDATTKDMYTALHIAAKEGQDEVAAVLIENGAVLDAATKKGFTPLHLTAKYGHIKVAQLLSQKEADVDAQGKNGVTPLHVACHYDNQIVALLLLEKGASPYATAKNGHTPLHIAARKNQMDIATTLLEYGAQANAESKAGFTPLHLSCQEGHSEISNLLIEHKAGVNNPAKNGLTPMHLCAQEDNVNVAEILQRNGANIDMATKAGYTPLHVASHFGQANMVRFLRQHGANVNAATSIGYTPLHQSAQQGHCHIVKLLLEHKANANAQTASGQTPLDIARKLGYISVLDSLKTITDESESSFQLHSEEKYRVVAPEAMHESFMSDSEEEGGEDNMLADQPYRYLTVDEMKSLGDDSLPIDVTRDERVDSNRMAQSSEFGGGLSQQQPIVEDAISPHKAQTYNAAAGKSMVDGIYMANGINEDDHRHVGRKLQWKSFLVSFLVDARGGAMRGCRHSGVRMIIPSRSTCQPTRVTCRYVKPQRTMHPPQLMEGEALASRVLELGPVSTKFIGPVIMEVPHFASLRGKEREIIVLRSDNGETWREHTTDNSEEIIHDVLQQCFEPEEITQLEEQAGNHVCRFVTYDFPQYFAVVTRIRQEVHAIGPEGGMVSSTVVPQVQAVFPQGALTKKIKVGLQAQPVDPDLTAKLLGRGVAVSPIVTVEPRRRKFHKAITLSMPAPKAHSQGMINQYSGNTPTLRLLCSITGGPSRAQWEDVTGSTPLTFVNDCVSFTTTVSARFWLMDCRNISEATKMATELYKEVIHVPFIAKFVVFAKKVEPFEARLRVFCMTDDREDKTLEKMELYTQVAKSRDVEVLEGKPQYIELAGNLVPVTKSGEQLQLPFKAFRENRLQFTVRVKDQHADIVGRTLFMKEPKVAKGEPPQHPICILNIVLPEPVIPDSITAFSDKITPTYRSSLLSFSKHQNDHYIGDIRIVDLSNLLGKDWIQLASEIDISPEETNELISQNTDSIARQAQSMIRLYKDKPNYDIHSLEQALISIGRDDIMNKCKSGRLSHSRDFDETDIMKISESVEDLVRQESKRIQQIHEREEVKYSAEEKEIEDSESDEEIAKRTVAERREKIVKRLSVERQIPASSQKKEITREITEIKRKSLIEDKKAIHQSEIFMQLPADNSVKSAIVPEQVIKMKMGKMDSTEVSKSDFDKELSHKLKSSSRSSEEEAPEEEDIGHNFQTYSQEVDNLKIVKDITSVEKPSKIIDTLIGENPSMDSGSKQLTEDFLTFEKLTQLQSQVLSTGIIVSEESIDESKEKFHKVKSTKNIKETAEEVVEKTVETATKKVESIVSTLESDLISTERKTFDDPVMPFSKEETSKASREIPRESVSVKDKIKAFTEPKIGKVKNELSTTTNSLEKEFKKAVEIKVDNDVFLTTKDLISSEGIYSHIVNESAKDQIKETYDTKNKVITSNVTETSKVFAESQDNDIKKQTSEFETKVPLEKESIVSRTKDFILTENKNEAETVKAFAEPKIYQTKEETVKFETQPKTSKELTEPKTYDVTKEPATLDIQFDSKIKHLNKKIVEKTDSAITEAKRVTEKTKSYVEQRANDVKEVEEHVKSLHDTKLQKHVVAKERSIAAETKSGTKKIKNFTESKTEDIQKDLLIVDTKVSEIKGTIAKETPAVLQIKSEDMKTATKEVTDKLLETEFLKLIETKTVAEAIKSFSEPKVVTSEIAEKVDNLIRSGKKESKTVSQTIKSISESYDKSSSIDSTSEKEKIIPIAKIGEKIADFEAKKVTYEYHGLEPKVNVDFPTKIEQEKEEFVCSEIATAPEAAPRKLNAVETSPQPTFEKSLEKLEEMQSIVADARKITKDFLKKEQQSQFPVQGAIKEETKLTEQTIKTTIHFPPTVETSVTDNISEKIKGQVESKSEKKTVSYDNVVKKMDEHSVQETVFDSRKLPNDFLNMEQKTHSAYEKQTSDDISELSTETSQHSVDKSPIIETDSKKLSLEQADTDAKKITHDFLSMEKKQQPFIASKPDKEKVMKETQRSSIIDEVLIKASDIMTTISAGTEIPREILTASKEEKEDNVTPLKSEQPKDDGIDMAAPVEVVKTLTREFLAFEQYAPMNTTPKPLNIDTKSNFKIEPMQENIVDVTSDFLSMQQKYKTDPTAKTTGDLAVPVSIEPRRSLTDAEFFKSVQESITKKMSEGLIDISDEIKIKESDIPHSQTPPPTPIETKIEKQEDEEVRQNPIMDEDDLIDTIKTLHKTTESKFERVSTISTIETLQTYVPEPEQIVSIETIATQETKSTDITPVPPTAITSVSPIIEVDSSVKVTDAPKAKPRCVKISTPTEDEDEGEEIEKPTSQLQYGIDERDVSLDLSDDLDVSLVPVPKPRSQIKTSDSYKNVESFNEQQAQQQQQYQPSQSDSLSLRSFDFTEETSRTEDPSVSISFSTKSQQVDYPQTGTTTATTLEEPATESVDLPSELSIDDGNVETERKTSFYIGESSRNIITKTTPTKLSTSDDPLTALLSTDQVEAKDIPSMNEFFVDSDEESDVFKEYVIIKPAEPEDGTRIRRQSSETRNDLLEEDTNSKETATAIVVPTNATTATGVATNEESLRKTITEQSFTTNTITSTTSTSLSALELIHSTGNGDFEISESMDIEAERSTDLDLSLEKSEWETTEKEIPPLGKGKVVHSPQQYILSSVTKEAATEEMVIRTLEEVQQSLEAAKDELKSVIKDGRSIKESPSKFEFRSFLQTIADAGGADDGDKASHSQKAVEDNAGLVQNEDISSFIGVPDNIQSINILKTEKIITATVIDNLNREAAILHYTQSVFDEKKGESSLGFISSGTGSSHDSHTYSEDNKLKEERASLGFISSETAEDFSSMEEYYQEKFATADVVTTAEEQILEPIESTTANVDTFERAIKSLGNVVHRVKSDSEDGPQNRWSVPEIDQSSSSESFYKSFEKTESHPLSSHIENLMTQANSSEYQTAADITYTNKETTEFASALSTLESSSGKTISSHESMRSFDSQSEMSANLGSIDISELSETLVASSTEEAEEIKRLQDLAGEEDSDDGLDLETTDYNVSESKMQQQSQMKRSQEMTFKSKSEEISGKPEEEVQDQENSIEFPKPKEIEKTWGLSYPLDEIGVDDLKDADDILLYHGDVRRSIDESKYASSLDEGSILSVSMSSTSNIDTVVENLEEVVGSVGASSLADIEGFAASSFTEETTFVMEIEGEIAGLCPQEALTNSPVGEAVTKHGHKNSESLSVSGDGLKDNIDKESALLQCEGKESESESDTDPYETEYARQFRSPSDRKGKKKKQIAAEIDHSFEAEKRPFTPSQMVAEVIVEDSLTEELEAKEILIKERRPSQNMLNYANIPDITITEDAQQKFYSSEVDTFEEKTLYKVKTEEQLHKATDDRPLKDEKEKTINIEEKNFQKLVQEQYRQKLAELKRDAIGNTDYDYNKAPDSPDSFEMVDQPDISDEFVIVEEVAKEANEDDLGGKSIRIAPTKYESKHDEEVEKIITKSAPADPKLGSQIYRDDLNFEFEESPPTARSGGAGSEPQDESDSGPDLAANNKRWVEMQLTDNQLRYPYDLTGGVLEDIKEEDGEFEVGSSRISSFKDSFSSTPEYDVMAARRHYGGRGEHDDISMSSLQEFESLEQAISLENRNRTQQGSTDSSNGSFQRRYIMRNNSGTGAQGDDISISSLKEFEGLENACIEAHLIEIKAREEAALLSRSDESNKSNGSDREQIVDPNKIVVSKVIQTVTRTQVVKSGDQLPDIETLLKKKLQECERTRGSLQITEIARAKTDSDKGSLDSLEMNRSSDMATSSVEDSFDISKDGTTKSDIDSLEVDKWQPTREESIESIEMENMDDVISKFGATLEEGLITATNTITSTDADGCEHATVITRTITKSTLSGGGVSSTSLDATAPQMMTKNFSADSLNQMSITDQTTTSSAGTTATYQTSAGNSQMSGSVTSCASSTLMEDSAMSMSGFTTSSNYWSHEEETVKEDLNEKSRDVLSKDGCPPTH